MKNLTLIICCCLLSGNLLWGQIEKGAISFSGNIGAEYTWAQSDQFQGYALDFNPAIAFMINDHWLIGGAIGTFTNDNISVSDNSFIQPEVRYYFNPAADKNKFYAGFIPSFNLDELDNSAYNFTFGFNRFLNQNVALDANATYTAIGNNAQDIININLGLRSFMSKTDRGNWKTAVSEFNKGDLLINTGIATASITGIGSGFTEFLQLSLNPSGGIFISEQWLLGAQLGASLASDLGSDLSLQTSSLSLAPFARYYLGNEQKHWRWFGQAGLSFMSSRVRFENNFNSNSSAFFLNSTWGANWFLTSNLAFELGVNLNYNFGTNTEATFTNGAGDDFDELLPDDGISIGASIGVQYFLNRKD